MAYSLPALCCSISPSCISQLAPATPEHGEPLDTEASRPASYVLERSPAFPAQWPGTTGHCCICYDATFGCLHSGSQHSGSPSAHCSKSTSSLDSSKVYIVTHGGGQQAPGAVTKPYHRQGAANKYVIGWKKSEGSPPPEEPEVTECPR